MQMLRFPLRQVFGDEVKPTTDAFIPSLNVAQLTVRFDLATRVLGH
jgi:hypothetical protein